MNPEIVFGLENAAWPALLVGTNGAIFRANPSALTFFGEILAGDELPPLAAVWGPGNESSAEDFIAHWEQTAKSIVHLKFKKPDGSPAGYGTAVSIFTSAKGTKLFVLQLVTPDSGAVESRPPAAVGATDTSGPVLKQKLECALQLARTVSLDFNNALTSILGHASFLLGKAEPGHPWRHSLMEVEKSAAAAAEIANELQVFSRQEKETRRTPPGNLNVVVNRCVDFFKNSTGDTISWNLQLEKSPFGVRFDEAKIQQAFTKILENAVESIPEGQRGQITIQTRDVELTTPTQDRNFQLAPGAYLCVEITDNGAGIDAQTLPRIFEPFFTTKKGGHRGLGLALVYGIVTNHGGGVAISSEPGKGTSARVYLPAEKQTVGDASAKVADLRGTQTVLVVDDEDMLLTMTDTILADYGYSVLTANGGQRALSILSRPGTTVDLIITDLVMPGMGGRELIDRIKQMYPATKIVCMSGYTTAAEKTPVPVSLRKPFTSVELLTKVKQALG
jgi:nitrogen-specific signal transduction histidine kinase